MAASSLVKMLIRVCSTTIVGFGAFYAFSVLPLAQVYALLFITPIVVTILSVPILGERVGLHRIAAIIVGFIGVIIVLPAFGRCVILGASFGSDCGIGWGDQYADYAANWPA